MKQLYTKNQIINRNVQRALNRETTPDEGLKLMNEAMGLYEKMSEQEKESLPRNVREIMDSYQHAKPATSVQFADWRAQPVHKNISQNSSEAMLRRNNEKDEELKHAERMNMIRNRFSDEVLRAAESEDTYQMDDDDEWSL